MAYSPKQDESSIVTFTILVNGKELNSSDSVYSVSIQKKVNTVPAAQIELFDGEMSTQDFPVSDSSEFVPGNSIEIKVGYATIDETIFKGIIIAQTLKISEFEGVRLSVECRDRTINMTKSYTSAQYVTIKDSKIIVSLAAKHGINAAVEETSFEHDRLVRVNSNDWNFIVQRASANGLWVLAENGKLAVQPPNVNSAEVLDLTYGYDIYEFEGKVDARDQFDQTVINYQNERFDSRMTAVGVEPELCKQGNLTGTALAAVIGASKLVLNSHVNLQTEEAQALADAHMLWSRLAKTQGTVTFQGNAQPKPNTVLKLSGLSNRMNGKVLVSAVYHEIADGNWITTCEFGQSKVASDQALAADASTLRSGDDWLFGMLRARVTNNIDPIGRGRVRIALPFVETETTEMWAPLLKMYSNQKSNSPILPEEGDEVLFAFEQGDVSSPIVVGAIYDPQSIQNS